MRTFFCIISILFIACKCQAQTHNTVLQEERSLARFRQLLQGKDSGFITKKQAISFLVSQLLLDTANSYSNSFKSNDIVGKFYRSGQTGNYIICFAAMELDYAYHAHLLVEMKLNKKLDIIRAEHYVQSNYACCWEGFDGFGKTGNWFFIRRCTTGTGFCASTLYFFDHVIPQDSITGIKDRMESSSGGAYQNVESKFQFSNNRLIFHYVVTDRRLLYRHKAYIYRKTNARKFGISYKLNNKDWVAVDTSKLKQLPYF